MPYAVAAVRSTPDVGILLLLRDLDASRDALEAEGFADRHSSGLVFAGEGVRPGPAPAPSRRVVALEAPVRFGLRSGRHGRANRPTIARATRRPSTAALTIPPA